MKKFNERLKELRLSNNYTQNDMAEKLNINVRQYRRYENDETSPTVDILIQLSNIFRLPSDYILGLTDNVEVNHFETINQMEELINIINVSEETEEYKVEFRNKISALNDSIKRNSENLTALQLIQYYKNLKEEAEEELKNSSEEIDYLLNNIAVNFIIDNKVREIIKHSSVDENNIPEETDEPKPEYKVSDVYDFYVNNKEYIQDTNKVIIKKSKLIFSNSEEMAMYLRYNYDELSDIDKKIFISIIEDTGFTIDEKLINEYHEFEIIKDDNKEEIIISIDRNPLIYKPIPKDIKLKYAPFNYILSPDKQNIRIDKHGGSTQNSLKFFKKYQPFLSEIVSAEMKRHKITGHFQLILTTKNGEEIGMNGFGSGYKGEGSRGTMKILKETGFNIPEDFAYEHKNETFRLTK